METFVVQVNISIDSNRIHTIYSHCIVYILARSQSHFADDTFELSSIYLVFVLMLKAERDSFFFFFDPDIFFHFPNQKE